MKHKIDERKLTPEQRDKLEAYQQTEKQLETLSDIADIIQELLQVTESDKKKDEKVISDLGALLMDIRESIKSLDKEVEAPDFAKPVVAAVEKLSKAVAKLELKPNIKVDAPQVNVEPASISVDLKGIEKILKNDISKAFKDAISLIPVPEAPDNSELLVAWEGISEQLLSIENATRMKPLPGSMTISNMPFTPGVDANYLDVQQTSSTMETYLFKLGGSTGSVVRTIVVTYTDSTKENIDTVSWN